MLPRAAAQGICLVPLLFQLFSIQAAEAAAPAVAGGQSPVRSEARQASPSPTPSPAAPDQSKPDATPTATSPTGAGTTSAGTPQATAGSTTNASALRREVFGYATAGSLSDSTIGYPSWNFDLLSTVAFFSIHVRYDGQLVGDSDFSVWDSSTFTNFLSTAHAHGTRVVVTITGPSNPIDLCDALYNDQTNTIPQLMNQVKAKGVDGVNIDYEGQLGNCQNVTDPSLNTTNQALMTKLAKDMRAALDAIKPGYYLSIATYSGSAAGNDGFFNIPDLNQYVDSFFVMAYDMDEANQGLTPLNNCPHFCLAPVSPVNGYYWNDTTSMTQYSSVVGANKVILGQPYYGRVGCVSSASDHAMVTSNFESATYTGAASVSSSPDVKPGTFAVHRDDFDPSGQDRWDSWYDLSLNCWRVMHWSDATTLGVRYNLVNQMNLRGVGLWTLNYGGGSTELWSALQTYFKGCYSVSLNANPAATVLAGTSVNLSATAGCPDPSPSYQFFVLAPGATSYQVLQPYSTSSTYTWSTQGLFPGTYRLAVWARDAASSGQFTNSFGSTDTAATINYTVTTQPCSAVSLSAAPSTPAAVGTPVTISAHASSCPNAQYQFWIMAPGSGHYTLAQAYSSTATYSWVTNNAVPGAYTLAVWARDVSSPGTLSNSLGRLDAAATIPYRVTTCTAVSLSAVPASAAKIGASVNFTATATGCPNPNPVYQFWVLAPGASSWTNVQAYSTTNTFSWSTGGKTPGTYSVAVWARDADSGGATSSAFGTSDAATTLSYTVTTCTGSTLSASPASQASAGTSVSFTATATGCPNPNPVYQFWILAPGATSWTMVQAYSTSNVFNWSTTTGTTRGIYQVAVWVRDASSGGAVSNSFGSSDVAAYIQYTVK